MKKPQYYLITLSKALLNMQVHTKCKQYRFYPLRVNDCCHRKHAIPLIIPLSGTWEFSASGIGYFIEYISRIAIIIEWAVGLAGYCSILLHGNALSESQCGQKVNRI